MNTLPARPNRSDGFLELARFTWFASARAAADSPPQGRLIFLLAELLRSASKGIGALSIQRLQVSPEEEAHIRQHPALFQIEDGFLLLPRYAAHAQQIRAFFSARLQAHSPQEDDAALYEALQELLPPFQSTHELSGEVIFDNAQQRLAVAGLLDAPIGVLTGGPGSGKTTTAAALLAIQKRLHPTLSAESFLLTAPTGKAACRLAEAITKATTQLRGLTPEERDFLRSIRTVTLHKALEWAPIPPERGGPFRRNALHPLDATLVLVDEASMVDLSLMHALLQALRPDARLLLLGDSDQLESVEVGGILSELVQRSVHAALPRHMADRLASRLQISKDAVEEHFQTGLPHAGHSPHPALPGLVYGLRYSWRAKHAPWILEFANRVRPGSRYSAQAVEAFLQNAPLSDAGGLAWHREETSDSRQSLCLDRWRHWADRVDSLENLSPDSPPAQLEIALRRLSEFQLLCSTNAQVDRANEEALQVLWNGRRHPLHVLPHGCPVILQANAPSLGLSNGDVGIALAPLPSTPAAWALFASPQGPPRFYPLAQLPKRRPAFAITIHKSQGSEWDHVAIEMPPRGDSGLLTKNLLYTAITRAKKRVDLLDPHHVLRDLLDTPDPDSV
ncbi:MAG: exodeoxyribonuclease alpha chain [Verrucomicrobiota bacterium]|jgi:exodeoxyribonuclease V alpha subunit